MEKRNDNCRIKKLKTSMKTLRYIMLVAMMVTSLSLNAEDFPSGEKFFSIRLHCSAVHVPAKIVWKQGMPVGVSISDNPVRVLSNVEEARSYDVITLKRNGYIFSYAGLGGHGASGRLIEKMIYSVNGKEWQSLLTESFYDTQNCPIVTDGSHLEPIPAKSCEVRLSDIVNESDFDGKDYCTVRFRVYMYVNVHTRSDNCTDHLKNICSEIVTLKVYKCDGGLIQADNEYHSSTSTEDEIYHIYAEDDGDGLKISNREDPTVYSNESQSWLWNVWDKSQEKNCVVAEVKKKVMSQYDYGVNVSYRQLIECPELGLSDENGENLKAGSEFYIDRVTYKNGNINCPSNKLHFKVYPAVKLPGFSRQIDTIVCEKKDGTETSDECFIIEGREVGVPDGFDSGSYGISYQWEYKAGNQNWIDLPFSTSSFATNELSNYSVSYGQKERFLYLKKEELKKGVTYKFRQKAVLTSFGGRTLYATGGYSEVTLNVYNSIKESDFVMDRMPIVCQGSAADTAINIVFEPMSDKSSYSIRDFESDKNGFRYDISISGLPDGDVKNTLNAESCRYPFTYNVLNDVAVRINVTDGCGSTVTLDDTILVKKRPTMSLSMIEGANCLVSTLNGKVYIAVAQGQRTALVSINGSDEDYAQSKYYVSLGKMDENGEVSYGDWFIINKVNGYSIQPSTCSHIKFKKELNGCESDEVYCEIQDCEKWINNIGIGSMKVTEYRICKGEGNPAILNSQLVGAYGEESYSYSWKYSKDSIVWLPIEGQNGKNLPENVIAVDSDTFYIVREVTSTMGLTQISNASNSVMIMRYHTPSIRALVNGTAQNEWKFCYGERIKFTIEDISPNGISENGEKYYNICRRDAENRYHAINSSWSNGLKDQVLELTKDTTLYGAVAMCGDTIYTDAIVITVGKRLDDFKESLGACKVKGDSVLVTLPEKEGFSYNFIYGGNPYPPTTKSIYVKLPEAGNAYYTIVVSHGECSVSVEKEVIAEEMQERLTQHPLILEEELVDGKVCAGVGATIKSETLDDRQEDMVYTWYEDGNKMKGTTSLYSYVPSQAGHTNTIVRQTDYYVRGSVSKELCMTKFDTIQISTIVPVKLGASSLSGTDFCYGDSILLNVGKASGGSGKGYEYNVYRKNDSRNYSKWVTRADNFSSDNYLVKDAVYADGIYSVVVQDKFCGGSLYSDSVSIGHFNVNKNEAFGLNSSKMFIEESELEGGKSANVILTSPEIDEWLSTSNESVMLTYTMNGGVDSTVKYVKGSGFVVPVGEDDFVDGVLKIAATKGVGDCKHTAYAEIFYSKGFGAQPWVKCLESESDNIVEGCRNAQVHLYVDSLNMPTYNDGVIDLGRVQYQWYKMGEQTVVQLGGATRSSYAAVVGDSSSYRCQIIYDVEGTGKNLKRVYSTTYIVKPIEIAKIGSVYFGKNGTFSKTACAGTSDLFTLDADVKANAKVTKMVWESSTDGENWSELSNVGSSITGATTASCQVNADVWSNMGIKAVYFRLRVYNSECGETMYSDNTIVLRIEERPKMDLSKVRLDGNGVIEESLKSLSFYTYRNEKFKYNWSYGNNENFETADIYTIKNEKGFVSGADSLFVYKENENGCLSDTATYKFRLYNVLSGEWIKSSTNLICIGTDPVEMTIVSIKGGTENVDDYKVEWQYRTHQMTFFDVITDDKHTPFELDTEDPISQHAYGARAHISFYNVSDSFDIRAVISCDNFPGSNLIMPVQKVKTVSRLEKGWINANTATICYDEPFVYIDGEPAMGGSGSYKYQWQKSEDNENWIDVTEQKSYAFIGRVEQPIYRLRNTTYFRRITRDEVCHMNVDTSRTKTVLVLPKVEIPANVVNYYPAVMSGERVVFQPNYTEYDYVWNKLGELGVEDTTYGVESYGRYESKPLYENTSYRLKVRYQNIPHCESDWDTVSVGVLQASGVELFFENHLSDENRYDANGDYWICSGGEVGMVRASGTNNSAKHQWMYGVNGSDLQKMYYEDGRAADGETVNADECQKIANAVKNTETKAPATKYVSFCRVDTFVVSNRTIAVPSDTIKVYIVPQLTLSADVWYLGDSIAGQLTTSRRSYCVNEAPQNIVRSVSDNVSDFWISRKIGPHLYDSHRDNDSLRISWEYLERRNSNEWIKVKEVGVTDYLSVGTFDLGDYVENPSGTYQVRSTLSDGCSSVSSNIVSLYWSDVRLENEPVRVYTVLDDDRVLTKGIEVGDSVILQCGTNEYPCFWFIDEKCTDTLVAGNRTCSFILDGKILKHLMSDPHIYLKRYDEVTGCMSSATAITISFGNKSYGGKIGSSQTVCQGEGFNGLSNRILASGNYLYPLEGKMNFTYSWQYTTDIDMGLWIGVNGNSSPNLSSEKVDSIVNLLNESEYWFRRVATNDSGRYTYSDTVRLSYFDSLKPGVVRLSGGVSAFCETNDMPYISTTSPQGGHTYNNDYRYQWQISVNGGEYNTIISSTIDSFNLGHMDMDTLDRGVNNIIGVRCAFSDLCGIAYSNELMLTLYRTNEAPGIYEDNMCGADTVVVRVEREEIEKKYIWMAYDSEGQPSWDRQDVDYRKLYRAWENENDIIQYSVHSVDVETGCESSPIFFNIDSLPHLTQADPTVDSIVCYGDISTIIGGEVSGGTGEKKFQWQYSYDEKFWESDPYGTASDYVTSKATLPRWFRRIVADECYSDTSAIVLIRPVDKLEFRKGDLVFNDHKCALRVILLDCTDSIRSSYTSADSWEFYSNGEYAFSRQFGSLSALEGFDGEKITYQISHVRDYDGLVCKSEPVEVTLYNSPDVTENLITTNDPVQCNGRLVNVRSSVLATNYHGEEDLNSILTAKWLVSKDGVTWNEQSVQSINSFSFRANDTMRIMRVVDNGCVNDTSNVVTIFGQPVESYDYANNLSMEIVSDMRDSSVVMNIVDGKNFSEGYYFLGDGHLPRVEGNVVALPYKTETYKDSLLQLLAISDICVNPYDINPLRGGVISFDGETMLCGGGEIPAIVATDVEGGYGNYKYQWQYSNAYTADFINIEGANDKEYVPKAVSVATKYRRITTDGEYTSRSNELTISIRPLPSVLDIVTNYSDSEMDEMGLEHTHSSASKTESLPMSLKNSAFNVDKIYWQKSYDAKEWHTVEIEEYNNSDLYEIDVEDLSPVVYYRFIGESSCGADTSKSFVVKTDFAPIITDNELILTDTVCAGDEYVRIAYRDPKSEMYEYSYSINSNLYGRIYRVNSSVPDEDVPNVAVQISEDEPVNDGIVISWPRESFDVTITRRFIATGATSKKTVHFEVVHLSASFKYNVDGVAEHNMGGRLNSVRLNQGSKVLFSADATSDRGASSISYKWQLIRPLNPEYYAEFGGSVGIEGLTSRLQNPTCFFYNAGTYRVQLEVTDGVCKSVMADSALYIDKNTVRSYLVGAAFADGDEPIDFQMPEVASYVDVYPSVVESSLEIVTNAKDILPYEVIDETGLKMTKGKVSGYERIDASSWCSGLYIVHVNGQIFKVLKR